MNSNVIYRQANSLIRRYSTNDPLIIAESMGINVRDVPELTDLLGMYTYKWKKRAIFMNPHINETLYRMVLGHEIGHDQLHRRLAAGDGFREFVLFEMNDMIEYEVLAPTHFVIQKALYFVMQTHVLSRWRHCILSGRPPVLSGSRCSRENKSDKPILRVSAG